MDHAPKLAASRGLALALALSVAVGAGACGGTAREPSVVGHSRELPVEWTVYDAEGVPVRLERLRGRILLVWIFATYDIASAAMISPLNRLVERRADQVRVLGIAAQPNARQLLPLFAEAMRLRFPVTWDPDGHVLGGASPLGPIDLVPTLVVLDRHGYRLGARPGAATDADLARLVDRALSGDGP